MSLGNGKTHVNVSDDDQRLLTLSGYCQSLAGIRHVSEYMPVWSRSTTFPKSLVAVEAQSTVTNEQQYPE